MTDKRPQTNTLGSKAREACSHDETQAQLPGIEVCCECGQIRFVTDQLETREGKR